ncbi:hypothetical protein Halhy_4101 [Haliscomenobacter hydrossis DSM 1100]|uniref:Uncharacterized protein n=1 Tax=Haliscomenobacter hydrossis (strain ATCC 27775 / DSM 1100 / LMG 10767 / O) TaxID=760192 RepID=F4L6Z4_HALH1|nr:hypothetical protein Halhy_4101 [Haliscomenobacter hydrossis DSM 1100]
MKNCSILNNTVRKTAHYKSLIKRSNAEADTLIECILSSILFFYFAVLPPLMKL